MSEGPRCPARVGAGDAACHVAGVVQKFDASPTLTNRPRVAGARVPYGRTASRSTTCPAASRRRGVVREVAPRASASSAGERRDRAPASPARQAWRGSPSRSPRRSESAPRDDRARTVLPSEADSRSPYSMRDGLVLIELVEGQAPLTPDSRCRFGGLPMPGRRPHFLRR